MDKKINRSEKSKIERELSLKFHYNCIYGIDHVCEKCGKAEEKHVVISDGQLLCKNCYDEE